MAGLLTPVAEPRITLVEGFSFAVSAPSGEITGGADGVYHRDVRVISRWSVLLDGQPPEPLSVHQDTPYAASFLSRHRGLLLERHRLVGDGLHEDLVLRNLSGADVSCRLTIDAATDLAGVFSVRAGKPTEQIAWSAAWSAHAGDLGVRICLDGAAESSVDVVVPARGRWRATVRVIPIVAGAELPPAFPVGVPLSEAGPIRRFRDWLDAGPEVDFERSTMDRGIADLGALRVPAAAPDGSVADAVAAGAPWYMTLFGRDSLLTAWMALPVSQELALSTCAALAALQGERVDPGTEEEPGRIPHEVRHAEFPLSPGHGVYYGTADASALFCMLVGELHRWGVPVERLAPLLPHVDRALDWIQRYGDRDGDGFVEYQRANDSGLRNQGWKDSATCMVFADGRLAEGPIALAEVQGYVYAAYLARSELAVAFGEDGAGWERRAAELRDRFHEAFWLPEHGYLAMALDGSKRPVDALASNIGHCLWTGLLRPELAGQVAERLMSPELFSGWGVRTLATSMAAYDPVSYHNGSVWPHDSALCAAGLARYGFVDQARRIAEGSFDAARAFSGRLPELFCGFDRAEYPHPVPYPTSCSPQAWAAATPFLLLRSLLGLEPDLPRGRIHLDPRADLGQIRNMPLAGVRVTVPGELHGLPGIEVVRHRIFA